MSEPNHNYSILSLPITIPSKRSNLSPFPQKSISKKNNETELNNDSKSEHCCNLKEDLSKSFESISKLSQMINQKHLNYSQIYYKSTFIYIIKIVPLRSSNKNNFVYNKFKQRRNSLIEKINNRISSIENDNMKWASNKENKENNMQKKKEDKENYDYNDNFTNCNMRYYFQDKNKESNKTELPCCFFK